MAVLGACFSAQSAKAVARFMSKVRSSEPCLASGQSCRSPRVARRFILWRVIDTDAKLAALLPTIKSADWLALDTEADSLHAYPEKICLIQISTVAGDELIDPLGEINLDPLLDALNAYELIMHGADYDLRLLRKHHEFVPSAIFDTMLAARLLGERQFGLGSLVEK